MRLALAALLVAMLGACGDAGRDRLARELTGGDPERGARAIRAHGCGTCHAIPGVRGARGSVGPSLAGLGGRAYLAGKLPNAPANLIRWIRDPQGVVPGNVMPNLPIGDTEARDIAAYLLTLR